jgi:RHS repeat-associated protein
LQSIAATTNSAYTGCSQETGFSQTANTSNRLSGFSYDASGNTAGDGVYTYTWDAESQLKTAGGVTYGYDGDGRRASKSNGKLYWYGSGGEILAETDASGNTTAEYVFFAGKRVAMLPSGGNPVYYIEDMLGTSRVITTNAGVVCYDADFYPYGGERSYTNSCPQNYKFEGKERDTETGNDDFGARSYSNRFGRWLSADWSAIPAAVPYANLANPQTLNLYSMVADDPESFADLDGHLGDPQNGTPTTPANCPNDGLASSSASNCSGVTPSAPVVQANHVQNQAADHMDLSDSSRFYSDPGTGLMIDMSNPQGNIQAAQTMMDAASVVPIIGLVTAPASAGLSLMQGDTKGAAVNMAMAVPLFGIGKAFKAAAATEEAVKLGKSLASEAQTAGKAAGAIAGAGSKGDKPLRAASRLAAEYGGKAKDWSKMTSGAYKAADGSVISTHWYEQVGSAIRYEMKSIIDSAPWNK